MSRNSLNQHGVENLYIKKDNRSKTGFSCQYKDPRYGLKEFGIITPFRSLGSNVHEAINSAKRLNALILPKIIDNKILDIYQSPSLASKTLKLSQWIEIYTKIQLDKIHYGSMKPNTWKMRKNILSVINKNHGSLRLDCITAKTIKTLLDSYVSEGKNRMAQSIRSVYSDLFCEAAGAGEIPSSTNPAKIVKNPIVKIKKSRLTLPQFENIIAHQNYLPHKAAYLLALTTGQRRTDLCLMRKFKGDDFDKRMFAYKNNPNYFIDINKSMGSFSSLVKNAPYSYIENDMLFIFQIKTGKMIKIPTNLTLLHLNISISKAIEMADTGIKSEFVLHHHTQRTTSPLGSPLHPDTLSRSFKRARTEAKISWQGTPATFHEIRSLSERLYREQGINTKVLCGHNDQSMTDRYNDLRGSDWLELKLK
ncbi:tyrosine-type recombinase/integrase [Shewanella frigidimarina]|uniref:tyrosine-type recombinase/integrase n=1 Tax=Shewanella frigidimarina TaxID=56812 RepID=UPI003D7A9DDC